ncbi:hypothetical protein BDV98DRAFT_298729 [Pterulicium gracile]|uniref:Uncharacterized protein n=1 Tax=Pterulicium gracile TaxID=1884261 RepID=A0A5C3Q711_9AGAR|nr:hypothetical protein BDV98DRAFT_298729 [Pterula gracilis]
MRQWVRAKHATALVLLDTLRYIAVGWVETMLWSDYVFLTHFIIHSSAVLPLHFRRNLDHFLLINANLDVHPPFDVAPFSSFDAQAVLSQIASVRTYEQDLQRSRNIHSPRMTEQVTRRRIKAV